MIKFLLNLLNIKYLLGFIETGVFPQQLSSEDEAKAINDLYDINKHDSARKKLIIHNLRLVGHIAKKYESKEDSYEDLISIGTIGLVKAIDTFSLEKNVKLGTYASRCIENEILMALRTNKKHSKDILLSDTIGTDKDGEEIKLEDVMYQNDESVEDKYEHNDKLRKLKKYIKILDDKEYQIISLRYGLDGNPEYTQKEIGKMFQISRSYVSRIEKRALIKLLQEFRKNN